MNENFNLALVGAKGRLGTTIAGYVASERMSLEIIPFYRKNVDQLFGGLMESAKETSFDVVLDVSSAENTAAILSELLEKKIKVRYVAGTTGFTKEQSAKMEEYSKTAPLLYASNFSLGVNLFIEALKDLTPKLQALGYKASLQEEHHAEKKDAPSGTAKTIAEKLSIKGKDISSVREGSTIGTHEVQFKGQYDFISLKHVAQDRILFAQGAIHAAKWILKMKKPGFFSMADTLDV